MKSGVAADWNIIAKKTATSNWPLADRKLSLIFWIPAQGRNDKFVSGERSQTSYAFKNLSVLNVLLHGEIIFSPTPFNSPILSDIYTKIDHHEDDLFLY